MTPGRPTGPLLWGAIGLLCFIWGTTWAAIQVGLVGIPPFSGAAIRFALAAALLLTLALFRGVRLGRTARERRLWVFNGLFSFSISYGVVYWSEQWVPSGLAAVLFATYPLIVAFLAHFFLPDEPMHRKELLGSMIGFGGVAVIFSEDLSLLGGPGVAPAAAVMLISPVSSAIGSVAVKRWGSGIHPFSITAIPMALCAGVVGALALALERDREFVWNGSSIAALAYLVIFGSAVTFTLYYWLLERLPAKNLALIAYVVPVVALIVGAIRGEPLTPRTIAGSVLVIGGVALAVQRLGRPTPGHEDRKLS